MITIPETPIITLTTDFGLVDEYVATIKGVILGFAPQCRIIDITHSLPPQDIGAASHIIERSFTFFPKNSIHIAIVDPGVGSERSIIAISYLSHLFIGPDNGLFTPILCGKGAKSIHRVTNPDFFLDNISATFHGRDIIAPVAAHLATGVAITELGPAISLEQCTLSERVCPIINQDRLIGKIVYIDRFGNLCSNISRQCFNDFIKESKEITVRIGDLEIPEINDCYANQPINSALAIFDSHNLLEIAIRNGNAAKSYNLSVTDRVIIRKR